MLKFLTVRFAQAGLAALMSGACLAVADESIRNLKVAALEWETTPEGVAFAALVGDRFAEPYMAMVRLPGGTVSPPHTKTATMYGVMLAGTMTHVPAGADPVHGTRLSEGDFYQVPAGLPHISSCVSQTECVTFLYQDGKFDFLPTAQ